ncbi:MAG: hypothetical protein WDN44_07195 [Sphingomonas sp.]
MKVATLGSTAVPPDEPTPRITMRNLSARAPRSTRRLGASRWMS